MCCLVFKETDDSPEEKPEIRVFHKTSYDDGYKPITVIMQQKNEYQKMLQRAYSELAAFEKKYNSLAELEGVFEQIHKLAV